MKKFILIGLLIIAGCNNTEDVKPLPIAYCEHMGYNIIIDSQTNRPLCSFDINTSCDTMSFYNHSCHLEKIKQIAPRKDGESIYTELGETCEVGLFISTPKYLLEQQICYKPNFFQKIEEELK